MRLDANKLSSAVRLALSLGVAATAGALGNAHAQTAADNATDQKSQSLETIVVTGSNIRRVDIETANPIVTIDKAAIQQSGKVTLGDLVQDLPAVTGPVTNPRVNNGGGTGASSISLRGLGSARTLILVNGHRYLLGDVNAIPADAIERIEVLTDGASSVYGSDAVGGVVNFILRSNYQGAEFSADYGISDRDDGQRQGYHFVFGQTTDKGSIMAGVDYNKFDSVLAANRQFSKNAIYYYYGAAHVAGGSSRTPTGNIQLPANLVGQFNCPKGGDRVTLKNLGSTGTSLSDYKCYSSADGFNFQAHGNVELTPQERSNAFVVGNYKLTDSIETYMEFFHNKTQSANSLAPQPIDTSGGPLIISAQNYYNPFGVDFADGANQLKTRSVGNGNRINNFSTTVDQFTGGFKGTFGDSSWQWNAYFNYGHYNTLSHTSGFINLNKLGAGLGPSFLNAQGVVQCGTAANPIALTDCTPVNFFSITDPNTVAALNSASGNTFTNTAFVDRSIVAEANGGLFDLPAGTVQLAAGASYRKQFGQIIPDAIEVPNAALVCDIGTGCVSAASGGYNVKEAYGELLIPILKDVPFASALNLTVGDRYSKYSDFGSTNNTKVAVEYRPIEDLLLRGTVSGVFRAPTISDLFQGSTSDAPFATDPCYNLVGTNAACVGVPGDGSFKKPPGGVAQINAGQSGSVPAGISLGAEQGKSFDYGFVYDPHWLPGLSVSVDLWRVYLNNEISRVTAQDALNLCFQANGGPFCSLIHRVASGPNAGNVSFIQEPKANLGRLDVKGADLALRYRLPETGIGNFALNFQTTYLDRYTDDPAPGTPGDFPREFAGHYSVPLQANFSRWKALSVLNWNLGPWSAAWTAKYVGKYNVGYANVNYGQSACKSESPPGCELKYGASVYHNVTAGYNIEPLNTHVDVGIDNVSDKQPALIYLNNGVNGNVDANTFDTIGRFYWARVTVKF